MIYAYSRWAQLFEVVCASVGKDGETCLVFLQILDI